MKTAKRVTTNVMLDARAHDALRKTAEADARSVSSLVRKIIADWYAQQPMPPQQRRREKRSEASAAA